MQIRDITSFLERIASPSLQEAYDNARLLVGASNASVNKVLCTLDVTEEVVEEAIDRNCQLIVAHHPIIFSGLKSLTGRNYVERTVIKAIQNNIGIYSIHTNLDNVLTNGVNQKLGDILGLQHTRILKPKANVFSLCQVRFRGSVEVFQDNFSEVDFSTIKVSGSDSDYSILDFQIPKSSKSTISDLFQKNKDIQWFRFFESDYSDYNIGSGLIGKLKEEMKVEKFFDLVKQKLKVPFIKHTGIVKDYVNTVALCGGAGGFLLREAIGQGADIFLTSDYKYHEFFDAEDNITIIDAGHFETEQFTRDLLTDLLNDNGFSAILSEVNTNPVQYY